MPAETLIIRADASAAIGHGHVMRCLALAEAWQQAGGDAVFAAGQTTPVLAERLRAQGMAVIALAAPPASSEDAAEIVKIARAHRARWVVVDGYNFGPNYQRCIKSAGFGLLAIDDYATDPHYYADWVLNADPPANEEMYAHREPNTRLMLGPEYALLREQFRRVGGRERTVPAVAHRILVTMGGSDPEGMSLTAIRGLAQLSDERLQVRVAVGPANRRAEELIQAAQTAPGAFEILEHIPDIALHMAWADIAVAAAGVTLFELLFVGTPIVGWPRYAQDVSVGTELQKMGAALPLPLHAGSSDIAAAVGDLMKDQQRRQRMSARGQEVVDGHGAERAVQALRAAKGRVSTEGRRER